MNGVVVRGVGGRRNEYRPIVSQLTSSTNPIEVAEALIEACHPIELYLADLDAIQGGDGSTHIWRQLFELGIEPWVDAGVRNSDSARQVADLGCHVVAGLETVPSIDALREIVSTIGSRRVIFSLDLRDGTPIREWGADALTIASRVVDCGVQRLIVLDLARVGVGGGSSTEELCLQICSRFPQLEVIAGGGVCGADDLKRLVECGVSGALVASALHDRRLPVPSTES